jgi:hypothetical protein
MAYTWDSYISKDNFRYFYLGGGGGGYKFRLFKTLLTSTATLFEQELKLISKPVITNRRFDKINFCSFSGKTDKTWLYLVKLRFLRLSDKQSLSSQNPAFKLILVYSPFC